jgi:hypothetical protein
VHHPKYTKPTYSLHSLGEELFVKVYLLWLEILVS